MWDCRRSTARLAAGAHLDRLTHSGRLVANPEVGELAAEGRAAPCGAVRIAVAKSPSHQQTHTTRAAAQYVEGQKIASANPSSNVCPFRAPRLHVFQFWGGVTETLAGSDHLRRLSISGVYPGRGRLLCPKRRVLRFCCALRCPRLHRRTPARG